MYCLSSMQVAKTEHFFTGGHLHVAKVFIYWCGAVGRQSVSKRTSLSRPIVHRQSTDSFFFHGAVLHSYRMLLGRVVLKH